MNLDEFATRLNSDIVGKLVNIASRCSGFIAKLAAGSLAAALPDAALFETFAAAGESIAKAYDARDTALAVREIMSLADRANQYIDAQSPGSWPRIQTRRSRARGLHPGLNYSGC